jgi:hypothetical protein
MMLLTGHPSWQNGMPQSMQRAACLLVSASESGLTNSFQERRRISGLS